MLKRIFSTFFVLAAFGLIGAAQQRAASQLPPPAVLTACLPDLGALEPLDHPDVGPGPTWAAGTARVSVTVDFFGKAQFELMDDTNPVVATMALDNLRTWKFATSQPGQVEVTYIVKIVGRPTRGAGNAKVEFDLPSRVTITVSPYLPIVEHAEPPGQPAPPPAVLVPAPHP